MNEVVTEGYRIWNEFHKCLEKKISRDNIKAASPTLGKKGTKWLLKFPFSSNSPADVIANSHILWPQSSS